MEKTIGLCDYVPTEECVVSCVLSIDRSFDRSFFEALPNMVEFANTYEV